MLRKITLGQFGGFVRKGTNGRRGLGIALTKETLVRFARAKSFYPKIPWLAVFRQSRRNCIRTRTAKQRLTEYFNGAQNISGGVAPRILPTNGEPQSSDEQLKEAVVLTAQGGF